MVRVHFILWVSDFMKDYDKPFLKFEKQVQHLKQRGLVVSDFSAARYLLAKTGYYYLSGYWYPFRKRDSFGVVVDDFEEGTTIEHVKELLSFDFSLKQILLSMITRIEIALRCSISYEIGARKPFEYVDVSSSIFEDGNNANHERWLQKLEERIKSACSYNEPVAMHYKKKYNRPWPIWVICDFWDFGMMTSLFKMLRAPLKVKIAKHWSINEKTLQTWLSPIQQIRNICAHNGRLWDRTLKYAPRYPLRNDKKAKDLFFLQEESYSLDKLAPSIFIILWLYRQSCGSLEACQQLRSLLLSFPQHKSVSLYDETISHTPFSMGFKAGWEQKSLFVVQV